MTSDRVAVWTVVQCVMFATAIGFLLDPTQPSGSRTLPPTFTTACEDTIHTCYLYGRGPCKDPAYEPWSRSHCALYCGFCNSTVSTPLACKDRLGNCGEYDGGDLCSSPSYYSWAYENCKVYCRFDGCAVDGNWADWSVWSNCDKTCENGTQVRTRTCTNDRPSPANGAVPAGNTCVGIGSETQTCTRDFCPVHGSWGSWSVWGECSVTCGVGMQRRDRHCDDPYPSRNGDHCFGEGAAYRICLPGACADGDWSSWQEWNNCSVECGGGIRSRNRTCDNPPPSTLGKSCLGNDREVDTCNNSPCANTKVAFSVYWSKSTLARDNTPTFINTLMNTGSYNMTTGKFTCPVAGIYIFSLTISHDSTNTGYPLCHYRVNGATKSYVGAYVDAYGESSGTIIVTLAVDDVVDLRCGGWEYEYHYYGTMFSGALITPT